jgi:hypothetical protein
MHRPSGRRSASAEEAADQYSSLWSINKYEVTLESDWARLPILIGEFLDYSRKTQIGMVIGSSGSAIRAINDSTGCSVIVEDNEGPFPAGVV